LAILSASFGLEFPEKTQVDLNIDGSLRQKYEAPPEQERRSEVAKR